MHYIHIFKETGEESNTVEISLLKKNLTPYSSLHLMDHVTLDKPVTYLTFWRIRSVLLSMTVCFLQMFLCEKSSGSDFCAVVLVKCSTV